MHLLDTTALAPSVTRTVLDAVGAYHHGLPGSATVGSLPIPGDGPSRHFHAMTVAAMGIDVVRELAPGMLMVLFGEAVSSVVEDLAPSTHPDDEDGTFPELEAVTTCTAALLLSLGDPTLAEQQLADYCECGYLTRAAVGFVAYLTEAADRYLGEHAPVLDRVALRALAVPTL